MIATVFIIRCLCTCLADLYFRQSSHFWLPLKCQILALVTTVAFDSQFEEKSQNTDVSEENVTEHWYFFQQNYTLCLFNLEFYICCQITKIIPTRDFYCQLYPNLSEIMPVGNSGHTDIQLKLDIVFHSVTRVVFWMNFDQTWLCLLRILPTWLSWLRIKDKSTNNSDPFDCLWRACSSEVEFLGREKRKQILAVLTANIRTYGLNLWCWTSCIQSWLVTSGLGIKVFTPGQKGTVA